MIRLLMLLLCSVPTPAIAAERPVFDLAFWSHWGDGRAELATYDLTFPRYGAQRRGTAVLIFVTETFSHSERVKSESPRCCNEDEYPVMKLNLVRDFPTGIYDYNLMTSAFVALTDHDGLKPGDLAKVSFSSQEWCGQTYHHLIFDDDAVRSVQHSYFQGEADEEQRIRRPPHGISEDALLLWARGLAGPALAPGQSVRVPILRSLTSVRMDHTSLEWADGTLKRTKESESIHVPAGDFAVERYTVEVRDVAWTFWVEQASPHRVVKWQSNGGETGELVKSERLKYWELNGAGKESRLGALGLQPRPQRTP